MYPQIMTFKNDPTLVVLFYKHKVGYVLEPSKSWKFSKGELCNCWNMEGFVPIKLNYILTLTCIQFNKLNIEEDN